MGGKAGPRGDMYCGVESGLLADPNIRLTALRSLTPGIDAARGASDRKPLKYRRVNSCNDD